MTGCWLIAQQVSVLCVEGAHQIGITGKWHYSSTAHALSLVCHEAMLDSLQNIHECFWLLCIAMTMSAAGEPAVRGWWIVKSDCSRPHRIWIRSVDDRSHRPAMC